jgi:cell division transport system permease protein
VAVLFIITNTIKLTIYSRRDEIEIFKLVGATDWFVKMPFLIEGAIQGVLSGFITLLILFIVYSLFSLQTVHIFGLPVMDIVFLPYGYMLLLFIFSLLLGLTGSFIAVGRFFRLLG